MKNEFKDLFSSHSNDYVRYRPNYPSHLFEFLSGLTAARGLAWDCGTGNGQAATELARYFTNVIATDPSEKQISNAVAQENIEYRVSTAEESGLENSSIDLICVAQALHWFRHSEFFEECRRVLKANGCLAFWCYELAEINPVIDACVYCLYSETLGGYWEKERKLVEEGYRNISVPFNEINHPSFQMTSVWSLEHFVGYLSTWSGLKTYINKHNENPLEKIYPELKNIWGDEAKKEVRWKIALRIFRK